MECIKCDKKYKSQKTLDIHMRRVHPVEDVKPEVEPDVKSDVKSEVNKDEQNHNCDSCIKCKDELEYYKKLSDALYIRYRKIEEHVDILMEEFLRNKYIKQHNEQNSDNKITEKEFDEMYKVMYPYVIPRSMCAEMLNELDTTLNDKYKDKGVTKEYKEKIIKNVKKLLQ